MIPAFYAGRHVWAKDPKRHIERPAGPARGALWRALGARATAAPRRAGGSRRWTRCCRPRRRCGHGPDGTGLGYVVALTVEDRREGTRFVHASDVQGPLSPVAAAYLARQRPTLLYLSGPPAYLESQLGAELMDRGIEHLLRIIDQTGCRVIFDHHALRDAAYPERFRRLWETGRVVTAAGYLGSGRAARGAPPASSGRAGASRRCRCARRGRAGWPGRRRGPRARATFNPRPRFGRVREG